MRSRQPGLCILIPVSIIVRLSLGGRSARLVLLTGYMWLGTVWLFLVAVVITEPIRLLYAAPRELALAALGLALSARPLDSLAISTTVDTQTASARPARSPSGATRLLGGRGPPTLP